jgi:hypothetical protein
MPRDCAAILMLLGAAAAPLGASPGDPVNFQDHVLPVLREHCLGCHRGSRARNGLKLTGLQSILEGGSGGPALALGDPDGSLLYQVITHQREPFMPLDAERLPLEVTGLIRAWIAAGAPESVAAAAAAAPTPRAVATPINLPASGATAVMPAGLGSEPWWWTQGGDAVVALAAAPAAPLLAVGAYGQIVLYHAQSLQLQGVLEFPAGNVHALTFARRGGVLIAGGGRGAESGRVVGYRVEDGGLAFQVGDEPDVVLAADLSADQRLVALGGPDRVVRVWSLAEGGLAYEIKRHTDWITALAFSPDGVLLASADRAGSVEVWEADTGREFHTLPAHTGRVTGLGWRGDSNLLVSAGEDGVIRQCEMEQGAAVRSWSAHGGVLSLWCAPDGSIASAGRDRLVRLWDGAGAARGQIGPLDDLATAVALAHDGSRVVAGSLSGAVTVHASSDGAVDGTVGAYPPTRARRAALEAQAALPVAEKMRDEAAALIGPAQDVAARRALEAEAALAAATAAAADLADAAAALQRARAEAEAFRQRGERLEVVLQQKGAALGAARTAAATLAQERDAALARMLELLGAAVAAEQAEADSGVSGSAPADQTLAEEMLRGATALAELAAARCATAEVELARREAEGSRWQAFATPVLAQAQASAERLAAAEAAHAGKAAGHEEASRRATELASVTAQAARDLEALREALDTAERRLAEAKATAASTAAAWEAQRGAITAAGGRVPRLTVQP